MRTVLEEIEIDTKYLKQNPINEQIYGEEEVDRRLIDSINELGQLEIIVVVEDKENPRTYFIHSGHRRVKALEVLGKKAKCIVVSFNDDKDNSKAEKYLLGYNIQRFKTLSQIVREAEVLRPIIAAESKKRQTAPLIQNSVVQNSAQREEFKKEEGRTRDLVADAVGIGRDPLEKATKIYEKAVAGDEHAKTLMLLLDNNETTPNAAYTNLLLSEAARSDEPGNNLDIELLYKLQKGEITVKKANKELEKLQRERKNLKEKKEKQKDECKINCGGSYSVLFADFTTSSPPLEDYMHLNVPAAKDSILFLQTTTEHLDEHLVTMKWWGFKFNSSCVLNKKIKNSASFFGGSHKMLLLGTKGNSQAFKPNNRPPSIIDEEKEYESVHEMIKKMLPGQRYIDLLPKEHHEGWDNWVLKEKEKEFKEISTKKLQRMLNELDKNESIKLILMGKEKQDDTQDHFIDYE